MKEKTVQHERQFIGDPEDDLRIRGEVALLHNDRGCLDVMVDCSLRDYENNVCISEDFYFDPEASDKSVQRTLNRMLDYEAMLRKIASILLDVAQGVSDARYSASEWAKEKGEKKKNGSEKD